MADWKLLWNGPKMIREVRKNLNDRLKVCADIQISEVQAWISHPCDGRPESHSKAPMGPYRESGELISSFKTRPDRNGTSIDIYNTSPHALPLELGWQPPGGHAFVPARPFQRRIFYKNTPRYGAILGQKMF